MNFDQIIIRFGAEPSKKQTVADVLKERNINLTRMEPSAVKVVGGPTAIQPNFSVYRSFLPRFINAAINQTYVRAGSSPYSPISYPQDLPILPIPYPALYVNWNVTVSEETKATLKASGFRDTMVKGSPALVHDNPTIDSYRLAKEHKCLSTTPAPENGINMFAFLYCTVINKLVCSFLKVHQYPAFVDREHVEEFEKSWITSDKAVTDSDDEMGDKEDDEEEQTTTEIKKGFRVNLTTPFKDMPLFYDEHSAPAGEGLLFQYVPELAKFDRQTILDVVNKYFLAGLGEDAEESLDTFQEMVSAMGIIQNTSWGNIFAHIFKCIDIAMKTQTQVCIIRTANTYDGVFLRGSGFKVKINGIEYSPASAENVKEAIPHIDYHANALWTILQRIDVTEDRRLESFRKMTTMKELKNLLDAVGVRGGSESRSIVEKQGKFLSFPGDKVVDPTANNIEHVLSFISDEAKDLNLLPYMHHSVLFSTSRLEIAMSAFGRYAPSFLVPGGKRMSLEGPFRVSNQVIKAREGPQAHRDVTKIGAVLEPLEDATKSLRKVIEGKYVENPFGNSIVNAAASHMNKVYEGESTMKILGALRKVAGTTVVDKGAGRKRKADDNAEIPTDRRKKGRLTDM